MAQDSPDGSERRAIALGGLKPKMTWRRFGLGLLDASINSAASSVVVIFVDPSTFNFGDGLAKLLTVFAAGALMGGFMWLKNHRLPGVYDDEYEEG